MGSIVTRMKSIAADPLFVRVCLVLWGFPFAALAAFGLLQLRPTDAFEWFAIGLLTLLGCYGVFLIYAGTFGSESLVERASGWVSDGSELLGIVLVVLVGIIAIPITHLLRRFLKRGET